MERVKELWSAFEAAMNQLATQHNTDAANTLPTEIVMSTVEQEIPDEPLVASVTLVTNTTPLEYRTT